MKPKLIIMVGNIASGKSTWIKKYVAEQPKDSIVVISKDGIRRMLGGGDYFWCPDLEHVVHTIAVNAVMDFMNQDINIIINETNMDVNSRSIWLAYITKFSSIGYDYHTVAAVMPFLERGSSLGRRMKGKDTAWGFSREVWAEVWDRKNSLYQEPKHSERFDEIWNINYSKENIDE